MHFVSHGRNGKFSEQSFLWKEGVRTSKSIQLSKAVFGESSESGSTVYRWIDRFKNGRTSLEDDSSGRPNTAVNEENVTVGKMLMEDRQITTRAIAASACIGFQKSS